jgi:hypothetical protein
MGRVFDRIKHNGHDFRALFDTGSTRTYISAEAARGFEVRPLEVAFKVGLGGKVHKVTKYCVLVGFLKGRKFETRAHVVAALGKDERGEPLDVIFGATSMEEWNIHVDVRRREVDLSRYQRDFTEYAAWS